MKRLGWFTLVALSAAAFLPACQHAQKEDAFTLEPDSNAGAFDGWVLAAKGSDVTVDLSMKDHVRPGMTFTVLDGGAPAFSSLAIKANIQILDVGPEFSHARVVRAIGSDVTVGDHIFNLVYHKEKTRQPCFVVYGEFDLNGDGAATAAERDQIVHMIVGWGGVVYDKVSAQTDYLVVGERPLPPSTQASAAPARGSIEDQRELDQQHYDAMINDAKRLAVPVLNSNRFLQLIGSYTPRKQQG